MLPTLRPGDRLLAVWWPGLRTGDLVVVRDPRDGHRLVVKRIARRRRRRLELVGDNPLASTDSRQFGPVPAWRAWRVVLRYAPRHRGHWFRNGRATHDLVGTTGDAGAAGGLPAQVAYDPTMASDSLARVLSPDYLAGLGSLPIEAIRDKRAESQELELGLSYARRLVQGRLDILQAELERRSSGKGRSNPSELVARLQDGGMFADHPRPPGFGRPPAAMEPGVAADDLVREIDEVVDPAELARLEELSDEDVARLGDRLGALERSLSDRRRALFDVIDACQAEIVRRYKSGSASPDALLS